MKVTRNELRLGNLLDFEGEVCIVREIDSSGAVVLFNNNEEDWIDLFQFSGIPLTEEWLLKFGFEEAKNIIPIYNLGLISIYLESDSYPEGMVYFNSWCIIKKKPKYVHQLQNLYFALTGEELVLSK